MADEYDTWIKVGHALKQYLGGHGYSLWVNWSKQSTKWDEDNESESWERWDSFDPNTINGQATLIYLAKKGG